MPIPEQRGAVHQVKEVHYETREETARREKGEDLERLYRNALNREQENRKAKRELQCQVKALASSNQELRELVKALEERLDCQAEKRKPELANMQLRRAS